MAKKRMNIRDLEELYSKEQQLSKQKLALLEDELDSLGTVFDLKKRIAIQQEINNERLKLAKTMQEAYTQATKDGYKITQQTTEAFNNRIKQQNTLIRNQNLIIKNNERVLRIKNDIVVKSRDIWQYLMQSDKVIRSTILNLGLSAAKAEEMRNSFEESAAYITRIGGNLGDIQVIMETFADQTGRARALSSDIVKDIGLIGKGTGLGVEQAAKLAAQFEYMGVNVRETMNYVQGVVETSELMGINTNKVLKNINDNFKELQTYNFRQGVRGFAEMAQYSEKFSMNMRSALDAADISRNLNGAINLAAQLQVMGGEFAKTDPFEMLFLSRNDPAEYAKRINEMTKGIVTFRKNSEGVFEKFISPADRDRLSFVAKQLGTTTEELTEQALRMADMQKMRREMVGMGLSEREKRLIEGSANFESKLGKFSVTVAGIKKDINDITEQDIKYLDRQTKLLDERAKAAQTFDDVYRQTIEEFKTILLPMLKGVNTVLKTIRPIVTKTMDFIGDFTEGKSDWLKIAGTLLSAGVVWGGVVRPLMGITKNLLSIKNIGSIVGGGVKTGGKSPIKSVGGSGIMKGGLGVGAAGLGIGGGIALASEGISHLADSMSKLTPEQAEVLKKIVNSLAILSGVGIAASVAIGAIGASSSMAAVGMLSLGASVLMIGGGIGIAAAGIGKMSEGLTKLVNSGENAGQSLFSIAGGITAISAALASMNIGLFGLPAFATTLGIISKRSDDIKKVGDAFNTINTVLSGSKENFSEIERIINVISNANFSNLKQIGQLKNLFDKPLKVEFDNKEVAMVSNILLNIDGYKFLEKIGTTGHVIQSKRAMLQGKEAGRNT